MKRLNCFGKIVFWFFIFVFSPMILAQSPHSKRRIGKIIIQGNKLVEDSAIRAKMTSKVGERYSAKKIRKDVRQIFNTGWFNEIEVQKKRRPNQTLSLIYKVQEKPIVEKIIYKGNSSLSKKELDDLFSISSYEFLDHKKTKQAIEDIKSEYEKKGYYLAEVSYSVQKTSHPGKVRLRVHIEENKKVSVKRVRFMGNKAISSKEIKSFMGTRETNLLSFISSAGTYNPEILEKDLNNIRFIYMDRGYWKVFVGKPEVMVSPNRTDITVSIPIQEGEQYQAGTIGFAGDLIFDEEYLKKGLETEESEIFSYGKLQRDIKRIETKYGDKGYAFVNVIPKFFNLPGDDGKTIHVLFEVQKGKKTKIGMIHITGNDYTRDKVIRREVRIFEGELYNETNKNRSVENIKKLGFFDDVKAIPKTIKNRDDLIDMEINIKERENTGTFEFGLGYDGFFGFSISGKLHKFNLFGKGYNVGMDVNLNLSRQYVNLNFVDPYFLDSDWYFGTDFYLDNWSEENEEIFSACNKLDEKTAEKESQLAGGTLTAEQLKKLDKEIESLDDRCISSFSKTTYRGFTEQKISGGVTLGRSLTDRWRLLFYYRLSLVELINTIDKTLYPVEEANGLRNPIEAIIEYDKRNDRIFPTAGMYSKSSITYDGILGKFDYFTLASNFRFYQNLFWNFIFRLNVQYSQHLTWDGEKSSVPFDQLFLLGGINSLRGFRYFSVGPRKRSQTLYEKAKKYGLENAEQISERAFGGMKEFYTNWELQFLVFPSVRLSAVLFLDVGGAFDEFQDMDLRANWGVGLRLFSPMGPIRLEMGFPFNPRSEYGEGSSEFQFTMGLPF